MTLHNAHMMDLEGASLLGAEKAVHGRELRPLLTVPPRPVQVHLDGVRLDLAHPCTHLKGQCHEVLTWILLRVATKF